MASTKKEVIVAIARIVVGLIVAYFLWQMLSGLSYFRVDDPWYMPYVPIIAAVVCGAIVAYIISKEKGTPEG